MNNKRASGIMTEMTTLSRFLEATQMAQSVAHWGGAIGWREALMPLWDPALSVAIEAASYLYAPDIADTHHLIRHNWDTIEQVVSSCFWKTLTIWKSRLPDTDADCYRTVVASVWDTLCVVRGMVLPSHPLLIDARNTAAFVLTNSEREQNPEIQPGGPMFDLALTVALRPVRRLRAGILTPEICVLLHEFHRGIWTTGLTKPQLWTIRTALTDTLNALPPDEMTTFWANLQSGDASLRQAMRIGLEALKSQRAVPHLLRGLEQSTDHAICTAIVDCLEQIGDPLALLTLHRLRQETAHSDWTLSRQMARAIRVIERHTRHQQGRTLLRPSQTPPDEIKSLLRPAASEQTARQDAANATELVRPVERGNKGE